MPYNNCEINFFPLPFATFRYESDDDWDRYLAVYRTSNLYEVKYEVKMALHKESMMAELPFPNPISSRVMDFYKSLTLENINIPRTFDVGKGESHRGKAYSFTLKVERVERYYDH